MSRTVVIVSCLVSWFTLNRPTIAADADAVTSDQQVTINIDADTQRGKLYNFWNVFPVTVQAPFKDKQKHADLQRTHPYARYINCVRFLGGIKLEKDDYFRGVDLDGCAICDFTEGIALLSGIRECGYTPWIVLDNVPADMCNAPTKDRYGNTQPPADFSVWRSYVRQLVQALVDEFGRDEVSQWRFRVGTEPDLKPGHWSGTKEEYLAHYDHTVAAVLSVIPNAQIGPGNIIDPSKKRKWLSWGMEIIDHCATGTNLATGEIGTPMTFFGSSYYTNVGTPDERFDGLINMIRKKLVQYPQFADVSIEIQEFGILSEGGKWIVGDGTEWGGSWMVHMANKIYQNRVPRVYQWTWNTTKTGGIPIPVTHVLGILEEMVGGQRLSAETSKESEVDDIGCIASRKEDSLDLLFYRHLSVRDHGELVKVRVVLEGKSLGNRDWIVARGSIIDPKHPGFMHEQKADMKKAREEMGEDANNFAIAMKVIPENREKYVRMSRLSQLKPLPDLTVDDAGRIHIDLRVYGHSVIHLRLE
jgi:xylan 1,4-beta-xylosidase